ncbi:MAG: type II toxin-antitoxin system HicA family toxin [Treponematales bacterium]|jgi:hypothetical protein
MKRGLFIRMLAERGAVFFRHGAKHDIYIQRSSGKKIAVPRHGEIENKFARIVLKELPR